MRTKTGNSIIRKIESFKNGCLMVIEAKVDKRHAGSRLFCRYDPSFNEFKHHMLMQRIVTTSRPLCSLGDSISMPIYRNMNRDVELFRLGLRFKDSSYKTAGIVIRRKTDNTAIDRKEIFGIEQKTGG